VQRGLGEAVDEQSEPTGGDDGSGEVEVPVALGPALVEQRQCRERNDQRDGGVDEQRPAPGQELGQGAAGDEADRCPRAGDRAVDGESLGPVSRLGEGRGDQGKDGRREQGGEDALDRAGAEEPARRLGEPAERGGAGVT